MVLRVLVVCGFLSCLRLAGGAGFMLVYLCELPGLTLVWGWYNTADSALGGFCWFWWFLLGWLAFGLGFC